MSSFHSLYPQIPGVLPWALYFIGIVSLANTVSAVISVSYTRRVYNAANQQATALQGRTFAIWTLLSGLIRLYASLHLENVHVYRLTFLTYILAALHFITETFLWGTAGLNGAVKAPLVVAGGMTIWMWAVWGEYVGGN